MIIMVIYIAQLLCKYTVLHHACSGMAILALKGIRRNKFTSPGSRETIVDRMPCHGAYALDEGFEPATHTSKRRGLRKSYVVTK